MRDLNPGLIELFVDGKEDGLPDYGRLDGLSLGSGSVVFMLHRLGWRWDECGSKTTLSEEGLVATHGCTQYGMGALTQYQGLVTGGSPMTEGRHYWEVELTWTAIEDFCNIYVGAVRPGLDHDQEHHNTNDAYYIWGDYGALFGNGKQYDDRQGNLVKGGRVGVLLDLDAGWLRFYRNGKRCGPGFTEGVTGPLVRAVQLCWKGEKVTVLPGAVAPEGAGAADEPWDEPDPDPESGESEE
jgi:hypothetical protein